MMKTGKIYEYQQSNNNNKKNNYNTNDTKNNNTSNSMREFSLSNEYLELIREGYDTVEFEDEKISGLHTYVCFSAPRCIPIYLLQFDQFM